jgi:hypothetical protein
MGKLTLNELASKKVTEKLVKTTKAIQGGDTEYCHEGYGKSTGGGRSRALVN